MGLTRFPHGISSFGIPVVGSGSIPATLGTYFFVNSNTGNDNNVGTDKDRPLATLDKATEKCTDNAGDVVVVAAGHNETLSGAGAITFDKAGVTYVGLGSGSLKPYFRMGTATTTTCLVTAANVTVQNISFQAYYADIVKFCAVAAKHNHWIDCEFIQQAADLNFITVMSIGTADNDSNGFEMHNCRIIQGDAADLHAIIINKDQNDVRLINNYIRGLYDASPYSAVYAPSTEVLLNFEMSYNMIYDSQADGNNAPTVNLACTTSTGIVRYNVAQVLDTSGETPFLGGAGGLGFFQNYASGVAGTASGYLKPAADS